MNASTKPTRDEWSQNWESNTLNTRRRSTKSLKRLPLRVSQHKWSEIEESDHHVFGVQCANMVWASRRKNQHWFDVTTTISNCKFSWHSQTVLLLTVSSTDMPRIYTRTWEEYQGINKPGPQCVCDDDATNSRPIFSLLLNKIWLK